MTKGSPARAVPLWFSAAAILLLAANLRVAVSSVGALLPDIQDGVGLGGFGTGLLTSLPPFCFGVMGLAGPVVARRIGLHRTALIALLLIAAGQLLRALLVGQLWLFAGSIISLAAIALANVIMPSLLRELFPDRLAGMTAAYTVVMSLAQALVSMTTIPLMGALGGDWRLGIGMWAAIAILAAVPWFPLARHEGRTPRPAATRLPLATLARVPRAWALALFFGSQSMQAYVIFGLYPTMLQDAGLTEGRAAAQVGIVSIAATIASVFAPSLLTRMRRPAVLTWVFCIAYLLGYLGVLLAADGPTILWSILIGIGQTYFPIALYIVNLRATTSTGVLSLSGFMQSVGYIYAGSGLLLIGALHGTSSDWSGVIIAMIVLTCVVQALALIGVSRWSIEDELAQRGLMSPAVPVAAETGGSSIASPPKD